MIKIKTADEINRIKESCMILSETFKEIKKIVEIGISTKEIDKFAHDFVVKRKAKPAFLGYMGFPASICTSVNEEVIHGIPSKYKLKNGDILSLDFGVIYNGFYSDSAITLGVGKISSEAKKLLKVTEESLYLGIEQVKVLNRIHDISKAVSKHASKYNYGIVKDFCGHGVGLELHEDPQIPNYLSRGPNPRIKEGMVFAIEPMINAGTSDVVVLEDDWTVVTTDKRISAHFEHTVAVMKDGVEILTK